MNVQEQIVEEIPRLVRYARALTRDVDRADDLVQECLCRGLSRVHLWEEGSNLRAWLFTIMHNEFVNQVRASVRRGMSVELDSAGLTTPPTQDHGLMLRDLARAMDTLSDEQFQTIMLRFIEDMTYDEIAKILDIPTGTVRSRLSRARDALGDRMGFDPLRDMMDRETAGVRSHAPGARPI